MSASRSVLSLRTSVAVTCSILLPFCALAATYPRSYHVYYSGDNPLFNLADVDVQPVPLVREAPILTEVLREIKNHVKVTLQFVVSKDGITEWVTLMDSSDSRFNDVTIVAVKGWRFKPAMKGGKNVNCRLQQELMFN